MFFRTIGRRGEARSAATALALAIASTFAHAADSTQVAGPAEARFRTDVGYLADDLREGRAPGTNGIEASADYIAGVFREIGLKTAPGAAKRALFLVVEDIV